MISSVPGRSVSPSVAWMRGLKLIALLLLVQYGSAKPTNSSPHTENVHEHGDQDPLDQDATPALVHEVATAEKAHHAEGDGRLNHEEVLAEPDQQLEEYDTTYYDEEEDQKKEVEKRGGTTHHIHAHKNHTAPRQKRALRSSEENEFDPLTLVPHKRHSSTKLEGHVPLDTRPKRSSDQGIDEDGSDGSFDGLEVEEREKRSIPVMNNPGQPEETVETEEAPQFPSELHRVDSVAFRVKRVSKAGSSHRNRLINKNKSNSKAGQTEDQPPVPE